MPLLDPRVRAAVVRFDADMDRALDRLRGRPAADRLFYVASELGDFSLVWGIFGALRGLRSASDWHAAARLGAAMATETLLVNGVVKSLFRRTRPSWDGGRPHHLRQPRTSSFPSGHATSAFSAAVLLAEDDCLWPVYFTVAAVVATSRVYVRIHHASDVAAGVALGVVVGLAARRIAPLPSASVRLTAGAVS